MQKSAFTKLNPYIEGDFVAKSKQQFNESRMVKTMANFHPVPLERGPLRVQSVDGKLNENSMKGMGFKLLKNLDKKHFDPARTVRLKPLQDRVECGSELRCKPRRASPAQASRTTRSARTTSR